MAWQRGTEPSAAFHDSVLAALHKWVELHPSPDTPALSIAQTGQFSPRQLLHEVDEQTETGQLLEEMIEVAAVRHPGGVLGVLSMFEETEISAALRASAHPAKKRRRKISFEPL